jgi:hypothetical protein
MRLVYADISPTTQRTFEPLNEKHQERETGSAEDPRETPLCRGLWALALASFFRFRSDIRDFRGGVVFIVARHSFRNLFRGQLAVIVRMQNV